MSRSREVWLIVSRELRRHLRSRKGFILILFCFFTALGWGLVGRFFARHGLLASIFGGVDTINKLSTEELQELKQKGLQSLPGASLAYASQLADVPETVIILGLASLIFMVPVIAILGFDSIAGETQYHTFRFMSLRTRRSSFYIGKMIGLWVTVSVLTAITHFLIWAQNLSFAAEKWSELMFWEFTYLGVCCICFLGWASLAIFVSSFFQTPVLALFSILGLYFMIWMARMVATARGWNWLFYLYPSQYDYYFLSGSKTQILAACLGMLSLVLVPTYLGVYFFEKKDT